MLLDDLERLRGSNQLLHLLDHYAEQNAVQPEAWLDRLMQIDGAGGQDLVRWHGELIACGWIEQNTGFTPSACSPGVVAGCYRVTPAGRRALRSAGAEERDEDIDARPPLPLEKKSERALRRAGISGEAANVDAA